MQCFIAIHGYQHGGVSLRVCAESKKEIYEVLPKFNWAVYAESDPNRPHMDVETRLHTTELLNPSPLLQELIAAEKAATAGRRSHYFRCKTANGAQYFNIWARSEAEVRDKYPELEPLTDETVSTEIVDAAIASHVDFPRAYLDRFIR